MQTKSIKLAPAVILMLAAGLLTAHAAPPTITVPASAVTPGAPLDWFAMSAVPYDPTPQSVFAGIWPCTVSRSWAYPWAEPGPAMCVTDGYGLLLTKTGAFSFPGFTNASNTDAWISLPVGGSDTRIGIPDYGTPVPCSTLLITDGASTVDLPTAMSNGWLDPQVPLKRWDTVTRMPAPVDYVNGSLSPWQSYMVSGRRDGIVLIVPKPGTVPPPNSGDVYAAKLQDDGSLVRVTSAIVTHVGPDFFYAQQMNRASGIRVYGGQSELAPGDCITFEGWVWTDTSGERCMVLDGLFPLGSGPLPMPLGLNCRWVGGRAWQYDPQTRAGQQAVTTSGGYGLSNVGLFIHTWGRVSYGSDSCSFTIDDGTGVNLKCVLPVGALLPVRRDWKYVDVTGVVSCYRDSTGSVRPQILLANDVPADGVLYKEPTTFGAKVSVDTTKTAGIVNPLLTGYNVTFWDMNDILGQRALSPRAVTSAFTVTDSFLKYVKDLKPRLLRYFGGDQYHWRWGVGPMTSRCRQLPGYSPWYVTLFGTDEFAKFCYDLDPSVPANRPKAIMIPNLLQVGDHGLGNVFPTGTPAATLLAAAQQEAANWVEYCNGTVDKLVTRNGKTKTVLQWAIDEGWQPSRFVDKNDRSASPQEVTDQRYEAVEWADGTHSWLSCATLSAKPSPLLGSGPLAGYYGVPRGYFAWLRRYFAWQRLPDAQKYRGSLPTWQSLTYFSESSYNAPYNMTYWEIGNEAWWSDQGSTVPGCTQLTGTTYAQLVHSYSTAMKDRDPNIKIGADAIGTKTTSADYGYSDWDKTLVQTVDPKKVDFLSVHHGSSLGSLAFETFNYYTPSERSVDFGAGGTYSFKVIARTQDEKGVSNAATVLNQFRLELADDWLNGCTFLLPGVLPTSLENAETATLNVPPGVHTVRLRNLRLDPASRDYGAAVNLYKVLMLRPGSSRWENILFPDDAEQQLLYNDYLAESKRISNPDRDAVNEANKPDEPWGLRDRLTTAGKSSVNIIVTEGTLSYNDGLVNGGYAAKEIPHGFRYKAAMWLPGFLKALQDSKVNGFCFYNLFDAGNWGLIRDPVRIPSGYPTNTNVNVRTVTPSYYIMKLWTKLQGGDLYNVNFGTPAETPCYVYPASLPVAYRHTPFAGAVASGWIEDCRRPQNIRYLDGFACKNNGKLYLFVSNRVSQYASATITTGTILIQPTANVSTLRIRNLVDRQPSPTWNAEPEMEANSETGVFDTGIALQPDDIGIDTSTISNASTRFAYTFAPYTVTLFEFTVR